jgi:hypothetical protein
MYTGSVKRSWNPALWVGFVLVLIGTASYPLFFIRFPVTRDFPWANLLLIAIALALLAVGLHRAFWRPEAYRGKISGSILGALGLAFAGLFLYVIFYAARQLPASAGSPRAGRVAPDFTVPDSLGHPVTLSALLDSPFGTNDWPSEAAGASRANGVVLIFYRGYW